MAEGIFQAIARRIQLRKNPLPVETNISSPIDLRERVRTGEQPIAIGNTVFVVSIFPKAIGDEPKFFLKEINPGRSLSGSVRIMDDQGAIKTVGKEFVSKKGGPPTYRITIEENIAAIVGPMDRSVEIPRNGKIIVVPSSLEGKKPQEIPISDWVLTPPAQTGPGK